VLPVLLVGIAATAVALVLSRGGDDPPAAQAYPNATAVYQALTDRGVGCDQADHEDAYYDTIGPVDELSCRATSSGGQVRIGVFPTEQPSQELLEAFGVHEVVGPNWLVATTDPALVDDVRDAIGGSAVTDPGAYPQQPNGARTTTTTTATTAPPRRTTSTTEVAALSGTACPSVPVAKVGRPLQVVETFATERFSIWICEDADGALTYYGRLKGGDPAVDSITLPAQATGGGYRASNRSATYLIDEDDLIVLDASGAQQLDEPVTDHRTG
jgi:hypothetical protein